MYGEIAGIKIVGVPRRGVYNLLIFTDQPDSGGRLSGIPDQNDAPPVTWAQFCEAFITTFILRSLRDRLRNQFVRLEQGSMTVTQYEVGFQELSMYAIVILSIEEEQIHCFVRGLRPLLRIGTLPLVTSGPSYLDIVDHSCTIE